MTRSLLNSALLFLLLCLDACAKDALPKVRGLRGSRAMEWMPSGAHKDVSEAAQSFEDDVELCPPSTPKAIPESLGQGLAANLARVKGKLARGDQSPPKLMAVIKPPDGGLPAPPEDMAAFYETLSYAPEAYGVESVTDAIAVRRAVQGNKSVLVMYPQEVELARLLWAEAIEVAISSESWVEAAAVALKGRQGDGKRLGVHLFVDTGMARTGAAPDDAAQIVAAVLRHSDVLELRGIMTHFCCTRGEWSYEWYGEPSKRRLDASKLHQQQKHRVQAVFQNLSALVASHRAASPAALSHRLLRHAAASDNVKLGESEMFFDMVRVGMSLIKGYQRDAWYGRPADECLLGKLDGCREGARIQALKTLPGKPGSEWTIEYACSKGYFEDTPCFFVDEPVLVASLSGVCHHSAYDRQNGSIMMPVHRLRSSVVVENTTGDADGVVARVPKGATLREGMNLMMMLQDTDYVDEGEDPANDEDYDQN